LGASASNPFAFLAAQFCQPSSARLRFGGKCATNGAFPPENSMRAEIEKLTAETQQSLALLRRYL
jgi:hypothetical protein